jgi:hypothetical protein
MKKRKMKIPKHKCNHTNISIWEYGTCSRFHRKEGRERQWLHGRNEDKFNTVRVYCYHCGFNRNYQLNKLPLWLKAVMDSMPYLPGKELKLESQNIIDERI